MKALNIALVVIGVVATIVVLALPIARYGGIDIKLLDAGTHGYLTIAALLTGAAMGAHNVIRTPARWATAIAVGAFLTAGVKLSGANSHGIKMAAGASGGMMLAFVGALLALGLTLKPVKSEWTPSHAAD